MSFLNETGLSYFWNKTKAFLDSKFTYKTEETRIGTWINGKPIYRKIFTGNVGTVSETSKQIYIGKIIGLDALIRMYGVLDRAGDTGKHVVPDHHDHPSGFNFSPQIWNTGLYMYVTGKGQIISVLNGSDFWLAVEYTKTTDTATVAASEFSVSNDILTTTPPVTSGI